MKRMTIAALAVLMFHAVAVQAATISGSDYQGRTVAQIAQEVCNTDKLYSVLVTPLVVIDGRTLDPRAHPQQKIGPYTELNFNCEKASPQVQSGDGSALQMPRFVTADESAPKMPSVLRMPRSASTAMTIMPKTQKTKAGSAVQSKKKHGKLRAHTKWNAQKRQKVHFNPAVLASVESVPASVSELYRDDPKARSAMLKAAQGSPITSEAQLGCDGIVSFRRGDVYVNTRPRAMALRGNKVVHSRRFIPSDCRSSTDEEHAVKVRVYRAGGSYMAMPIGSENPMPLVFENTTPAIVGDKVAIDQQITYCLGSDPGKLDKETYEAIFGATTTFGGGFSGVDGWAVLEGYCMIHRDKNGGRHYLGVGGTFFGGTGRVDSWDYGYRGVMLRAPSYKWVSEDGGHKFIADLFWEVNSDHGSDGMGYTNQRDYTLGGIHLGYINEERHIAGKEFFTGFRLDISYAFILSQSGSHKWRGENIADTSELMRSFGNRLTLGARVYIWDIPNTKNRVFAQIGYSRTIGQFDDTLGAFVGLEYNDGVASIWVGPVVDIRSGRVRGLAGAEVDVGQIYFQRHSAQQIKAAESAFRDRKASPGARMTAKLSQKKLKSTVPKAVAPTPNEEFKFWEH